MLSLDIFSTLLSKPTTTTIIMFLLLLYYYYGLKQVKAKGHLKHTSAKRNSGFTEH